MTRHEQYCWYMIRAYCGQISTLCSKYGLVHRVDLSETDLRAVRINNNVIKQYTHYVKMYTKFLKKASEKSICT